MILLINEQQAAEMLGVSVHKMRRDRWAGGGVPFVKMLGAVRYEVKALEGYIASQTRKSTSDTGNNHAA